MPNVRFRRLAEHLSPGGKPVDVTIEVPAMTKVLRAAGLAKVDLRFACAACRCGTCAVRIGGAAGMETELTPMRDDERALLTRIGLALDGTVRLACQARVMSRDVEVDLGYQDTYSPDQLEQD